MLTQGSMTAFWLQLKGSNPPDFDHQYHHHYYYYYYIHPPTHTPTPTHPHTSKSLACMTGDGQKQIMVIDRCLEMDLCVCLCVSEQKIGTEGSVQNLLIVSSSLCLEIKVSSARSHLLETW